MTAPVATYRLQLHADFTFEDARAVVGYLADLGISHLYLSPIVAAAAGSRHGYDVVDPTQVNPELGGRAALEALAAEAHAHGLGIVIDIVPNHLAASPDNPWWRELLSDGPAGAHARDFDVDWSEGRVLLPLLDGSVDDAVRSGRVKVEAGVLDVNGLRLPLRDDDASGDVRAVLDRQFYELVDWHEPRRNYRRFFDVDSLVGVRIEDPIVFADRHALIFDLVDAGVADGLRVDHIDGLRDPLGYLRELRDRIGPDTYLVVEKITTGDEALRDEWPVEGTTGYDALTDLDDVFVEPGGWHRMRGSARTDGAEPFDDVEFGAKRFVLHALFTPELRRLTRDMTPEATAAITALTVTLSVYRVYVDRDGVRATDRTVLEAAARDAVRRGDVDTGAVDAIVELLTSEEGRELAMSWQQLTGPVMAKGHEDTALYRDAVLVSRNDVGGEPGRPPDDAVERLHRRNAARARHWPRTMQTTSTHDTKRSEDVRARIAVLSELPDEFEEGLRRLRARVPLDALGPTEQRLLAQTLLGVWPAADAGDADVDELRERLHGYFEKALREAKLETSWLAPNEKHERAVRRAVDACIADGGAALHACFSDLVGRVAFHGAMNSLALVLLKLAGPGVADAYQGCELLDLSLVDPDNRRAVDYERRRDALRSVAETPVAELGDAWSDGRLKLLVTTRALAARRKHPELFVGGDYTPLASVGDERVLAFARHRGEGWAVALVSRFTTRGTPAGTVSLPPGAPTLWRDAITGATVAARDAALPVPAVLAELPVALLLPA
ncbi:MAG TPA: malto-oligosyltrehalose synthase [Acidimicrobiia bacterium]